MSRMNRREMLKWLSLAPTLPAFFVESAHAVASQAPAGAGYDGPIVIALRMMGGNDGLNTVVPFHDDRYYKVRPTIGIAKKDTIAMPGGEMGLNPWLTDVHHLMEDGHAAIVQSVGYASSSRSHTRSTEIYETGSTMETPPSEGWLGRYLDHVCECGSEPLAGVQFADALGRTLASNSGRSKSIGNPKLLLEMNADRLATPVSRGSRPNRMDYLHQVENDLGEAARQLRRASKGTGGLYGYPETSFGQSLRWTGDMIETGSPTRLYYVTLGSFDGPATPSFDTHSEELDRHKVLFTELGRGLKAFRDQMKKSGQLNRVLLVTFSDFGRQVPENRDGGTDHGDASVLFMMGGKVRPGLLGKSADLGRVNDGGLEPSVDFRQIYAGILRDWLKTDAAKVLGTNVEPFKVLA